MKKDKNDKDKYVWISQAVNFDKEIMVHNILRLAEIPIEILKELIFDVYLLSCKTKNVIYIKSRSVQKNSYFIERMCGKDATITKIRNIYIWELRNFVNQQDAVFVDIHKSFTHLFDGGFLIPSDVRQVFDNDMHIHEMIKLNNKELKKLTKYSYEISKDPDALKFFYEVIYTPYIKGRYGVVEDFIYFKKSLRKGELLLIKLNGEYVSGALCEIHNNTYYCQKNGVIDENFVKDGALLATYYFSILRAKEVDVKIIDFGLSKPFLSDGVLWHKNRWGVRICEQESTKRFIYLKNVLFEDPFIYIEKGKLKAAIFSENDRFIKEYANSGLEFSLIDK